MERLSGLFNVLKNSGVTTAGKYALGIVGLGGTIYAGYENCFFTVTAGHRAIMFHRVSGIGEEIYGEGLHFKLPWFDRPILFDIRTRPRSISSLTGSKDLQMVQVQVRVLSKPAVNRLPTIYRLLHHDQDDRVLPSIVNEVLKSVVARFNASQLLTQRELVSRTIRDQLIRRAADFHIELEDVAITHLSFSQEYTNAVESKQVAQQEAERAKYFVTRALEDKKSRILIAQADAQSAELIGQDATPAYLELKRLEIAKESAKVFAKSNNKLVLDASQLVVQP